MMFSDKVIDITVQKLIRGENHREYIINSINAEFLDFSIDFFKKIVLRKMSDDYINLDWYKNNFIQSTDIDSQDIAIFAGTNKKTIYNIYGDAKKQTVIDASIKNFEYISGLITSLKGDLKDDIAVTIKIEYKNIGVNLNLEESLIVINALATKKVALRGSTWSSIGKKIEKPLLIKLCQLCNVPDKNIDSSIFKQNNKKNFDREVDFKLIGDNGEEYRIEVKLMGKGNPESADVIYARDTNIFIADTLSNQNKEQLKSNDIYFIELRNNSRIIEDFKSIITNLNIKI